MCVVLLARPVEIEPSGSGILCVVSMVRATDFEPVV
jgi:hypothetical protein